MIVYDYFGGTILRGHSEKLNLFHFWNEVNGEKIDLTSKQFKSELVFDKVIERKKHQLLKINNVRTRYELLSKHVSYHLHDEH